MSGVQVWRMCASFVSSLDFVKVLELFQSMFVYSSNRFSQVTVHLRTADIKVNVVIVDDPWKNRVLRKVVVGTVCNYIDKVNVLHISNLPIGPHVNNISQLDFHHFLSFFLQVSVDHFPWWLLSKYKEQRIRVVVEPDLNANLLEQVPITSDELDLAVGEL